MRNSVRIWGSVLALLIVSAIAFSPVSGDAPYYLAVARDIADGAVPYRDLTLGYTPLTMYLNAVLFTFTSSYPFFLFFQCLIVLLSGFLLYRIAIGKGLSAIKSALLVLLFGICILSSDGTYINLEVYNIFFMLAAYWLLMHEKYLLSGMVLALTFFCKQYGILNFVPFALLVLTTESRFKNTILLGLGGLIPLVLFLGYYCGVVHIPLEDLLAQLSGKGYGEKHLAQTKTILGFFNGAKVFLLLVLPLIFLKFNPFKNKEQLILSVGVVFVLLPVLVQNFQHYFLNAFPYVALLIALNWKEREVPLSVLHVSMGIAALFLFVRLYNYTSKANLQHQVATEMAQLHPKTATVYLKGTINYLYVLNDYRNPALRPVGYGYAFKPDTAFLEKYVVLSYERIPDQIPVRITTVSGTKIYEY